MKLRVRFKKGRNGCLSVDLEPKGLKTTLGELQAIVGERLRTQPEAEEIRRQPFSFSLNGREPLQATKESNAELKALPLSSFGIISGDLLHLIPDLNPMERPPLKEPPLASPFLDQLVEMGFKKDEAARALEATGETSLDAAIEHIQQQQQQGIQQSQLQEQARSTEAHSSQSRY